MAQVRVALLRKPKFYENLERVGRRLCMERGYFAWEIACRNDCPAMFAELTKKRHPVVGNGSL